MQLTLPFNISKTLKDLFEDAPASEAAAAWDRDWKMISSLHIDLPEKNEDKLCSLFLRMSTVFEAGIYCQKQQVGKTSEWKQILAFHRGEIKSPSSPHVPPPRMSALHQIEKTDSALWKDLFAKHFKQDLEKISVYKIHLNADTFILVADRLADPWMKQLMSQIAERVLRGIA